ncbi:MAG: SelB C-terminal domain-containing protein, partial [Chloroflexi bacterium]|nr:SelB C-terminal domain-containing protein [Chloroflexota bacterium]
GRLSVGQEIEVQPGNLKARARGLQTHKQKVDLALPGSRVAVNLGGLATTDLRRGQVVTTPGWLRPTRLLDASLTVLRSAPGPLAHNAWVTFHTGAAEATARVALLERDELGRGERGWAQIRLEEPVAVAKGDLFVIRTPNATIGGGEVVDAQARRHRRQQPSVVETLRLLQTGSPEELVMATVGAHRFTDVATVALRVSLAAKQATLVVERLVEREALLRLGEALMTRPNWEGLVADVVATLGAYHEQYPLRSGMSKEELRSRLDVPTRLHSAVLDRLAAGGHVVVGELVVALPGHRACFRPEQESAVQAGLAQVERGRFSPPSLPELGFDAEVVAALVEQGKLVRVSEAIVFAPSAYREMVERIRQHLLTAGTITVAEVRDMFDTSRRYALALLEHLDDQRVTRRVGDARVLR